MQANRGKKMPQKAEINEEKGIQREKTDEEILQDEIVRRARSARRTASWFGTIGVVLLAFLAVIHLFVGVGKVFSVTFSLPAIVEWMTLLSSVTIIAPEAQLSSLIFGVLFFIAYVVVAVTIIKNLVRAIRKLLSVYETKSINTDYNQILSQLFEHSSLGYAAALSFGMAALSTVEKGASLFFVILLGLYGVFFVASIVKTNADLYKKEDEDYKKQVTVSVLKRLFLVLFSGALVVLCLDSQLLEFTQNLAKNYSSSVRFEGISAVEKFVFPLVSWLLVINSVQLCKQTLLIFSKNEQSNQQSFYGQSVQIGQSALQLHVKSKRKGLIFWSIVCILLNVLFDCFNSNNEFIAPDIYKLFTENIVYFVIIVFAIVAYILSKPKRVNRVKNGK